MPKMKINTYVIFIYLTAFVCQIKCFSNESTITNDKTLVCACINGLCNRLKSVASCYVLAEAYSRDLEVCWLNVDKPNESQTIAYSSWHDLFVSPKLTLINRLPREGVLYGYKSPIDSAGLLLINEELANPGKTMEEITLQSLHSNSPGAECVFDVPSECKSVVIQTIHNVRPKEISDADFLEKKRLFYQSLIPVPYVKDAVDRYAAKFTPKTIGVHIRTTDLMRLIWQTTEPAYWKYQKAMQEEIDKDPEVNFFISADTRTALRYFKSIFGKRIMFHKGAYEGNGDAKRSSLKGTWDALVDLFLLSRTSKMIGTKFSSFTYEAACIGGIPIIAEITH